MVGKTEISWVPIVFIGAASLSLLAFNGASSLWTSSAVVSKPTFSSAVRVQRPQWSGSLPVVSVGASQPIADVQTGNAAQESLEEKFSAMNYVLPALVPLVGLFTAIWTRAHLAKKADDLEALDIMRSGATINMAASAGESETTYHFLIANAKFMLFDEEHAMELLREKRRFLKEKGMPQDFWMVPNPEFLDQFPDIDKRVLKPSCALVSTDEKWILFMKLRYDRVLMGSFKGSSDPKKALATKGGDPIAAVPKWEVPANWAKEVPYPRYSADWFHPFVVGATTF